MVAIDGIIALIVIGGVVVSIRTLAKVYLERARMRAAATPPIQLERLERIEQAVDAIAIEVERISESQRFTAKLLAERSKDPSVR